MIRTVVKYIFDHRELIHNLILLKAIHIKNTNSKIKIRKYILKDEGILQNSKNYLLKNFNEIIRRLESSQLILKEKINYTATKMGIDLLKRYVGLSFNELPILDTLQVWTETDLEKITEKR